jgi:hypothetical protein
LAPGRCWDEVTRQGSAEERASAGLQMASHGCKVMVWKMAGQNVEHYSIPGEVCSAEVSTNAADFVMPSSVAHAADGQQSPTDMPRLLSTYQPYHLLA